MGYVVAAYAIVVGCLALYGLRISRERRRLDRRSRVSEEEGAA